MSSRMRDWIRPTVCDQLNQAIQAIERDGTNSNPYGENGTLMIHITTGASIQLIEFISHAAPYSTWVSDSFTQIQAIFSKSSTESLQTLYGRKFSLCSLGAVLGITDYYLTINPMNAPSCRIILKIERFTILGSEGSRAFGSPSRIESAAVVEKLVSQMNIKWHKLNLDQPSVFNQISPIRSQASIEADTSSIAEESTLENFSTQTPIKVLHQPTTGGNANQNASRLALLQILGPKRSKAANVRDHEPPMSLSYSNGLDLSIKLKDRGIDCAPMPSVSVQYSGIHQSITAESITVGPPSSRKGHLRDHISIQQAMSESTLSSSQEVTGVRRNDVNGVLVIHKTPIEATISLQNAADNSSNSISINSVEPQRPHTPSQPIPDMGHPWEGFTRIPRKYVQIPKDQQSVLDDDRAWRSQAHGNRQPDENLPRNVLYGLHAFHNRPRHDEKTRQVDNQSDSSSENSESQKDCPEKSNHNMESQSAKSLRAQGQDSTRLSTLGYEDPNKSLNPTSASSRETIQFRNGIPATTEISSEGEGEHGNPAQKSRIEVRKGLPNDQAFSNLDLYVSDMSQEIEDDSTEEFNSWPLSQNRTESPTSPTSLLPERLQESTSAVQIDLLKSPQSQMLSGNNSPMPVTDAASSLSKGSQRKSHVNPNSDSESHVGPESKTANVQFVRPSQPSYSGSNVVFSSSPMEMELSVPYALDSQDLKSDDVLTSDDFHAMRHVPLPGQGTHSSLESERIDSSLAGPQPPRKKPYTEFNGMSKLKGQLASILSDPVIPGTSFSDVSNVKRPAELVSLEVHAQLDHIALHAGQLVSAAPGSPSPFYSHYNSFEDNEMFLNGSKNEDDFESQNLLDIDKHLQLSIPGTQVSYCEPLCPPTHALLAEEVICSTLALPSKRREYEMQDIAEPSPKRRRTLQAVIFDSVQEKDSPIDPTEMAKANRRKFLQDLSVDDNSLLEILQKSQKGTGVQPQILDSVRTSLHRVSTSDSVGAPNIDQQEARQSHQGVDLSGRHPKKLAIEDLQEKLINHSRQSTTNANGRVSDENEVDRVNTQTDEIGSLQGKMASGYERISTDNSNFAQCEGSLAMSKSNPRSEPKSQTETIFETFNTAYPTYCKSLRAFIRSCVYLHWLHSTKRAPHPSLWDDFIRVFSSEYASHIDECWRSHSKPMSAHTYYNNHVLIPLFKEGIMNAAKVQEAFLLDPRETAKSSAIIARKKDQKGLESTPTVSSQLTMTSEIFTDCQGMANLYPVSSVPTRPQPSNTTTTHCDSTLLENGVVLTLNHSRDVVRASDNMLPAKGPFLETPSQLGTKDFHEAVGLPCFGSPAPDDVFRINAGTGFFEEPGSPDMDIAHANGVKPTLRRPHLPYSPRQNLGSVKPPDVSEENRKRPSMTCQMQTHRRSPLPDAALMEREESPILGNETPNLVKMGNDPKQAEPSPRLLTNLALYQDPVLKVPDLRALKPVGRGSTSASKFNELHPEISPTCPSTNGLHSLRMEKTQLSSVSATFKDFSRAFVPRQRRRSKFTTRQLSEVFEHLSSVQVNRTAEIDTVNFRPPVEPDTQVWKF